MRSMGAEFIPPTSAFVDLGPGLRRDERRLRREPPSPGQLFHRVARLALIALVIAALAGSAQAQLLRRGPRADPPVRPAPADLPPLEAEIWPFPAPDPKTWWSDDWPKPPDAADPLGGGRRLGHGERLAPIDNGVDPSTYRLWGLTPLQWQIVR